jgi:hypothetical protein
MKAYCSLLLFVGLVGTCLSFIPDSQGTIKGFGKDAKIYQKLPQSEANVIVEKITDIHGISQTIIQLDSTKLGVCDTCLGNVKSVLATNRSLVDSIQIENSRLYEKYIQCINLNVDLSNINNLIRNQIANSKARLEVKDPALMAKK